MSSTSPKYCLLLSRGFCTARDKLILKLFVFQEQPLAPVEHHVACILHVAGMGQSTQTKKENAFFFNVSLEELKASWDYSSHHSGL